MSEQTSFQILAVCTANLCRSPQIEGFLRRRLATDARPDVTASSAGTAARDDVAVPRDTLKSALELGLDLAAHTPRAVTAELIARADLVLTADRGQRRQLALLLPGAGARVYTLAEFVRLASVAADQAGAARSPTLWSLVRAAHRQRGLVRPRHPDDDDISDPFGRPLRVHRAVTRTIADTVDDLGGIFHRWSVR